MPCIGTALPTGVICGLVFGCESGLIGIRTVSTEEPKFCIGGAGDKYSLAAINDSKTVMTTVAILDNN